MINIFLFFAIAFLFIWVVGNAFEKIHIPWIFSALIFGGILSLFNPFPEIINSDVFKVLAELGMYFLLFIIGFEIDIKEIKKQSKVIIKSTFIITLFSGICGAILIYYLFNLSFLLSFLVGLSFATVGEAVLLPILDKFNIVNTKLGQLIISIGVLDDIFEVFTLIFASLLISSSINPSHHLGLVGLSLIALFALSSLLTKIKKERKRFLTSPVETLFLFIVAMLFLFVGLGKFADIDAIAALLAGIALRNFIPKERLEVIESEIKSICYGLFAPLFFIWVGVGININYLLKFPILVGVFFLVSGGAKILSSILIGYKELGFKNSFLLGIGLSVRFSTSIVLIKYLFLNKLISTELYSILVASTTLFTLSIPLLFTFLLDRWNIKQSKNI